jgi:hypothetical protein
MTRARWAIVAGVALAIVAAFFGGRYSRAARVETRTVRDETAIVNAVAEARAQWQRETTAHTVIRTSYAPTGKPVERVETRDTASTSSGSSAATSAVQAQTTSHTETIKIVEASRPDWAAGVAGTWSPSRLSLAPERLGVDLDRRLFGTLWLGVRASATTTAADPQFGLALRMEF